VCTSLHAYAQAINAVAEAEIGTHSEVGKRNVDPVDVVDDVEKKNKRKQAGGNSPPRSNSNLRQARYEAHSIASPG